MANDVYEVNFLEKTNWINWKKIKCYFNKTFKQLLKKNKNNLVELYLAYDTNYITAKTKVL